MKLNSIDKCFQIIELLHTNRQSLRLSEISSMLNLHPSSVHHMLNTLLPRNYIAQCPETKKYSLGFRFLEISKGILENMDIRSIARKYLEELHKESREAVAVPLGPLGGWALQVDLFVVRGIHVRNLQSSWRAPDGEANSMWGPCTSLWVVHARPRSPESGFLFGYLDHLTLRSFGANYLGPNRREFASGWGEL